MVLQPGHRPAAAAKKTSKNPSGRIDSRHWGFVMDWLASAPAGAEAKAAS